MLRVVQLGVFSTYIGVEVWVVARDFVSVARYGGDHFAGSFVGNRAMGCVVSVVLSFFILVTSGRILGLFNVDTRVTY